jgi:hypothetical protein
MLQCGAPSWRGLRRRNADNDGGEVRGLAAALALAGILTFTNSGAKASDEFLLLRLDGTFVKWGTPVLGTGAKVRYAFAEREMRFAGARNCAGIAQVDALVSGASVSRAIFEREVAAAFALWQSAADITFVHVDDPSIADILIGSQASPRDWAFANVAYHRAENAETRQIEKSLICLNPYRKWKVGFGGDKDAYDLRFVIAHEIGHAIGLDHPSPRGQLMSFSYSEVFRGLQPGDLQGVVTLYGRRGAPVSAPPRTTAGVSPPDMALK